MSSNFIERLPACIAAEAAGAVALFAQMGMVGFWFGVGGLVYLFGPEIIGEKRPDESRPKKKK